MLLFNAVMKMLSPKTVILSYQHVLVCSDAVIFTNIICRWTNISSMQCNQQDATHSLSDLLNETHLMVWSSDNYSAVVLICLLVLM